jgi:phosphate transport system permease protein
MAYGTAFVLIVLLLIINLICHFIGDFREGEKWKN